MAFDGRLAVNVIVCVKQVPEVADAELELDEEGTDIEREDLVMGLNEWDSYAVEEALRIKEAQGGAVTVVTLGDEEAEDVLRRALAMGADEAVRIDPDGFEGSDGVGIARGLAAAIRARAFDLVLTGAMSADDGWGQVGPILAELLGLPYATLAVQIDIAGSAIEVHRELESNTHEKVSLPLPALVTVQTGINEPRYVSVMGIRKVRKVAIEELDAEELGLSPDEIGHAGSGVGWRQISLPTAEPRAEMLTGSLEAIGEQAAQIIREKGGLG